MSTEPNTPSPAALRAADRIKFSVNPKLTSLSIARIIDAEFAEAGKDRERLEAVRYWFLQRLSEENCMGTIVDVFTSIREDIEDADSFRWAIDRAIGALPPTPSAREEGAK